MTKIVLPSASAALSFGFSSPLKRTGSTARVPQSSSGVNRVHCIYSVLPEVPQEVTAFISTEKGPPKADFPATLTALEIEG